MITTILGLWASYQIWCLLFGSFFGPVFFIGLGILIAFALFVPEEDFQDGAG